MAAKPHLVATAHAVRGLRGLLAFVILQGSMAQADSRGVPAVIVEPTDASRSEIKGVLRRALGGTAPVLADDALTTTSVLSLDNGQARDPNRLLLNGRDLSRPEIFALVRSGSHCKLVQVKTGKAWTLHHTTCRAALPAP
jgi:hypothetical protein